jgi:hypothetical protein
VFREQLLAVGKYGSVHWKFRKALIQKRGIPGPHPIRAVISRALLYARDNYIFISAIAVAPG